MMRSINHLHIYGCTLATITIPVPTCVHQWEAMRVLWKARVDTKMVTYPHIYGCTLAAKKVQLVGSDKNRSRWASPYMHLVLFLDYTTDPTREIIVTCIYGWSMPPRPFTLFTCHSHQEVSASHHSDHVSMPVRPMKDIYIAFCMV